MTVTYSEIVRTATKFTFLKLITKWRGSFYKLIYPDIIIFLIIYFGFLCLNMFALNSERRQTFAGIAEYCSQTARNAPVAFLLGFYVEMVSTRWWSQLMALPYPDRIAIALMSYLPGATSRERKLRQIIMRYINASTVLTLRSVAVKMKMEYPTEDTLIQKYFTEEEYISFKNTNIQSNKYFIPLAWAINKIDEAYEMKLISEMAYVDHLLNEITEFRNTLQKLFDYDWINPPLLYTQVTTICVYVFLVANLFSLQFIQAESDKEKGIHIPAMNGFAGLIKVVFFLGWLKVAESLFNPYGLNDDDFEINELMERNLEVSYMIVDSKYQQYPNLSTDCLWDAEDENLPYAGPKKPMSTSCSYVNTDKNREASRPIPIRRGRLDEESATSE